MNIRANPRPFLTGPFLAAFAAIALVSCDTGGGSDNPGDPPLEGATIGGEFELTNSSGETVRWSDFDGEYRVVYFGYAYCPDACPTDVQRTMQGLDQFARIHPEKAAAIRPIFISVDPDRDTPEVIDQFTNAFSENLIGLTGTPEQIAAAARTFGVYYTKLGEGGGDDYLMDHSRIAFLFGPNGEPITMLPHDEGADAVTAELEKWVS